MECPLSDTLQQMTKVLNHIAKKERFHLPPEAANQIISTSNGNLRKVLLVFEAMKMQKPDLQGDIEVAKPDWETYCNKIADSILQEQTAQRLLDVRGKIYELLSHCIPPGMVLKVSLSVLVRGRGRGRSGRRMSRIGVDGPW